MKKKKVTPKSLRILRKFGLSHTQAGAIYNAAMLVTSDEEFADALLTQAVHEALFFNRNIFQLKNKKEKGGEA